MLTSGLNILSGKINDTKNPTIKGTITPNEVITTEAMPFFLISLRFVSIPAENIIRFTPIVASVLITTL